MERTPSGMMVAEPATRSKAASPANPAQQNGHDNHDAHDPDGVDLNVPKARGSHVLIAAVAAVVLLVALLVGGWIPRMHQSRDLRADAADEQNAPVTVNIAKPKRSEKEVKFTIPGTLRPWQEVSIFARTNGYLKKYYVDISEPVKAGQLMAEIETPEVDQQLGQAQAALAQTKAAVNKAVTDRDLAKVTYDRFVGLKESHSVALQDVDEKLAAYKAAESSLASANANVDAAEATVRQLLQMQSFEKVIAPFSGVCTGRAYDVGSFIVGNPTAVDVKPMFKIAENDVLRAFVNVPQSTALQITKGMDVQITVRERPGRTFVGKVMGTTNYLDQTNRSLLTEVKIVNPQEPGGEFALLPGMYVQATFTIARDTPPLLIPGPSLVSNADGNRVAVVDHGVVHFKKVILGQDYGNEIEVVEGLTGDEQVIANPGERVVEGAAVVAADSGREPDAAKAKGSQVAKD